jgi:hypothetical protein
MPFITMHPAIEVGIVVFIVLLPAKIGLWNVSLWFVFIYLTVFM